jgi:hypothetical protein
MMPISHTPGWITRKPNAPAAAAPTAAPPAFSKQLQSLLDKTRPAAPDADAPSRATIGRLHPGGMNDAAHHLLRLGGH